MRVDISIVKRMFQEPVDSVIEHVDNLLREPAVKGCSAIIMVGGFSESPMLQETVKTKFPNLKIIVPEEAGLAVLKGAVIYGHRPAIISARISKYTWGVACIQSYDARRHPKNRKYVNVDGNEEVKNVFRIHVKAGEKLDGDTVQSENQYNVAEADQTGANVQIFATLKHDPKFVDEPGCSRRALMHVDMPGTGRDRHIIVCMRFGGTEMKASATVAHTGEIVIAKLDFLDIL